MVGHRQTISRANHKTNKRMSIFRYSQIRSYKTVPNDFFVELKRYFVTQGFKIKRFNYTETSGQMVGRKDGWHLNFVPKFVLDIKQVNGVHFITFNYFARVRKIGIATGIATQGITALVGAATITGYLAAARNFVDAVGKAMDVLAGTPISVEWLEKEEADANEAAAANNNNSSVTYNTTNIQNVQQDPAHNNVATKETVVEHHHHYYYGGAAPNEFAQPPAHREVVTATAAAPLVEVPAVTAPTTVVEPTPQRLAIMPSQPSQQFRQCDLEKELLSMYERGEYEQATSSLPAANPFYGGSEASVNGGRYQDAPSSHMFHGGSEASANGRYENEPSSYMFHGEANATAHESAPAVNPFSYEDQPVPQYTVPTQHAPLYSIEPMSYKQVNADNNLRLEEIRHIAPVATTANPFYDYSSKQKLADPNDPFSDLLATPASYGYAGK